MKPYILVNQDVKSCAACWTGVVGGGAQQRWCYLKKKKRWGKFAQQTMKKCKWIEISVGWDEDDEDEKKSGGIGLSLIAPKAVKRDPFNVSHMCREAERRVVMEGDGAWAHLFIHDLAFWKPYRANTELALTFCFICLYWFRKDMSQGGRGICVG